MTKAEIQMLYEYDKWANLKLIEVLATLTINQFKKDLGCSFGGIHGTLVHILSADKVWLSRWTNKIPTPLKPEDIPAIEVAKKHMDTFQIEVGNFLRSLTDEQLNGPLQYTDFKGNTNAQLLRQQMQHKVNHSSYHRGQIVTMLRQLGIKPVSTDFINFLRQKEVND
jgi:uncharacterized damage-inducible protein DinB